MKYIVKIFSFLALIFFLQPIQAQNYMGGELRSKQKFKYGKFQALIKVDWGSGLVNGFFLYEPDSWKDGHYWREIDFEVLGKNTQETTYNIHYGYGHGNNNHPEMKKRWIWEGSKNTRNLANDYYWFTIEWTPHKITRYIHTKDWSQQVMYHSIWTNNVKVKWNGKNKNLNRSQFNNNEMDVRFNFWAFNEPGWSGYIDNSRIGKAKMEVDKFVYYSFEYYKNGKASQPQWKWQWEDNFDDKSWRWNWNVGGYKLGKDTRVRSNEHGNLITNYGKAIFSIKWNANNREEQEDSPLATIYPNPIHDELTIDVVNPEDYDSYNIINSNGQKVAQGNVNDYQVKVDLSGKLSAGLYQVLLIGPEKHATLKLMKSH